MGPARYRARKRDCRRPIPNVRRIGRTDLPNAAAAVLRGENSSFCGQVTSARYRPLLVTTDGPDPTTELTGSGLAAERARRQAQVEALREAGRRAVPLPLRPHPHGRRGAPQLRSDLDAGHRDHRRGPGRRPAGAERDSGKLVFATMLDRGVEIQLFVSKAVVGDDAFGFIKTLDRGDWVGVDGTVMTTRKGELSVKVDTLDAAGQVDPPAARQVARPDRPRHPLPPALRRPRRQRRGPPGLRRPPRRDRQLPPHVRPSAASSRSRRRSCTSRPAGRTPDRSRPTTTRSTWSCTCASPWSCTSSG